jgi:transcriptional regulator with GAF, ATPase, and Fis domain
MAKISLISKYIPPITVPPLRQRKEDIPLMVQAFIERYSGNLGKQISSIQKDNDGREDIGRDGAKPNS